MCIRDRSQTSSTVAVITAPRTGRCAAAAPSLQLHYSYVQVLKSPPRRDVRREVTTLADSARQIEAQLPGPESANAFRPAAAPVARVSLVALTDPEGEQLSVRATRRARAELEDLLIQLGSDAADGPAGMRIALLAADGFARRLAPGLLRYLEHDDLALSLIHI